MVNSSNFKLRRSLIFIEKGSCKVVVQPRTGLNKHIYEINYNYLSPTETIYEQNKMAIEIQNHHRRSTPYGVEQTNLNFIL